MKLQFFCPRWGSEYLPWDDFFQKVRRAGYDGVEWAIAATVTPAEIETVLELAGRQQLLLIAQHYDTTEADFTKYCDRFGKWLEKIEFYPWTRINSQTGKDYFSFEQNAALIKMAGPGVVHETHRGKFSFAAHTTLHYLKSLRDLRLTLDVSHWVSVAESFLEDQGEALEWAIARTEHIHARVGYTQGPQVPDPTLNEWRFAVEHHISWWDQVVAVREEKGEPLSITPEFGPYPYMVQLPKGKLPIADQWKTNEYMMNLLKARYA